VLFSTPGPLSVVRSKTRQLAPTPTSTPPAPGRAAATAQAPERLTRQVERASTIAGYMEPLREQYVSATLRAATSAPQCGRAGGAGFSLKGACGECGSRAEDLQSSTTSVHGRIDWTMPPCVIQLHIPHERPQPSRAAPLRCRDLPTCLFPRRVATGQGVQVGRSDQRACQCSKDGAGGPHSRRVAPVRRRAGEGRSSQ